MIGRRTACTKKRTSSALYGEESAADHLVMLRGTFAAHKVQTNRQVLSQRRTPPNRFPELFCAARLGDMAFKKIMINSKLKINRGFKFEVQL